MNNIITSDTIHSFFLLVFKDELPMYNFSQSSLSGLDIFRTMRDNNTLTGFIKVNDVQFNIMRQYYPNHMLNAYKYDPIMLVSYTMKLIIFNEQIFNPNVKTHLDLLIKVMSDAKYSTNILESSKTLFEQAINTSRDSIINLIKKEKYDKFIEAVNNYKDIRKNNYQQRINDAYDAMMNAIAALNTAKRNYENTLALNEKHTLSQDNMVLDLYNFFTRCKQLMGFAVEQKSDYYSIRLLTKALPVEYTVAENVLTALIDNPNGSKYKLPQESKDILKDAFSDRNRYITLIDPVDIEFRLYNSGAEIYYKIYYNYCQRFFNVHHHNYTCFGGFAPSLAEAIHNNNLIQLTSILLQYLQTINLQDVAGQNWINNQVLLILDKETNNYFIMDSEGKLSKYTYNKESYAIKEFKQNFECKVIKED